LVPPPPPPRAGSLLGGPPRAVAQSRDAEGIEKVLGEAEAMAERGEHDAAVRLFDQALLGMPNSPRALANKAQLLFAARRYSEVRCDAGRLLTSV
jgi:hypothetical protein